MRAENTVKFTSLHFEIKILFFLEDIQFAIFVVITTDVSVIFWIES